MSKLKNCLLTAVLLTVLVNITFAQSSSILGQAGNRQPVAAFPFLLITPDARTAGLGEAGVASSPDANAAYWNPAKLVRLPEQSNFSFSYTPWLSKVVSNMHLYHLSGAQKLGEKDALGLSLTYFDLGDLQLTNSSGSLLSLDNPYELSTSVSYARELSKQWSVGGSAKYIGNNYSGNFSTSGVSQNASGFAIDIGALYQKDFSLFQKESVLTLGTSITNLGPKMTYFGEEMFLPANLSLGASFSSQPHPDHSLPGLADQF